MKAVIIASLIFLFLIGFASASLSDGLVSYYKLDGNANDAVGLDNGVIHGANCNYNVADRVGNACDFDGVNDYIEVS